MSDAIAEYLLSTVKTQSTCKLTQYKHATITMFFLLPLCLALHPCYGPAHRKGGHCNNIAVLLHKCESRESGKITGYTKG